MTRYTCTASTCPRRSPVAAPEPPVCYTCGERMAEANERTTYRDDVEMVFGDLRIKGTLDGPFIDLPAPTPDANMPRIADLVNVTIEAMPTGRSYDSPEEFARELKRLMAEDRVPYTESSDSASPAFRNDTDVADHDSVGTPWYRAPRPLLQPIDDIHLHSDNIHWRDEPLEYDSASALAPEQRLAEAAAATPERSHADARKVIDLCSLLRSLPDVQRVAIVEYERGDIEVFVDGGRDEQILAHLSEAAASYEMRGQIAATVTDSSGVNLRGVAFSRGAQSVGLGPVARGVRYATATWGSGYAHNYFIIDDRDTAERIQRIVDLSA